MPFPITLHHAFRGIKRPFYQLCYVVGIWYCFACFCLVKGPPQKSALSWLGHPRLHTTLWWISLKHELWYVAYHEWKFKNRFLAVAEGTIVKWEECRHKKENEEQERHFCLVLLFSYGLFYSRSQTDSKLHLWSSPGCSSVPQFLLSLFPLVLPPQPSKVQCGPKVAPLNSTVLCLLSGKAH